MRGDRRATIRKKLHPLYLPYYDALCEELSAIWHPYYGHRSFEQQAALYAKGRTLPGSIVTNAKPGESAHNYGCASDWTIWDENDHVIWMKKDDKRWQEYERACVKVGLDWGGFFPNFPDFFHNQLPLKTTWKKVKEVYDKEGIDKAYQFIEAQRG